ncbi:MAG: group I intron-associated PD-(D/E)XK endonuclease, partial [Nevskia sp.]|uniref:group I intron-associated PD-(D/E)XK endonuclease n=1 Tax=Nevskia sp. TaxID=1929292 RepID=UPI00403670FF
MATTGVFRSRAGFGRRIEYWIIGRMLKDGLDVYVPLVDDHAVDLIVKRRDGSIAQVQVKARSADVKMGDAALFAAITHDLRQDYWFVFYSERLDITLLMTSAEFLEH